MQQGYAESFPSTAGRATAFIDSFSPAPVPFTVVGSTNEPQPDRILIIGDGRNGKDEAAATLHGKGNLRCKGSTSWVATPFVAEALGQIPQYAFEHRHERRQFWKDYCDYLRRDDPLFLVRLLLVDGGNIVTGLRDLVEIQAAKDSGLFREILWVNRPGMPKDPTVAYDPSKFCTSWILNDGNLTSFKYTVLAWAVKHNFLTIDVLNDYYQGLTAEEQSFTDLLSHT